MHRRHFLAEAIRLGWLGALPAATLAACTRALPERRVALAPPLLLPARDPTTGLELIRLPEGFRYFSFGWTGEPLADGGRTPGNHDGMGIVAAHGSRVTLVRNHEVGEAKGAFGAPDLAFDPLCGGGCVRLEVDLAAEKLLRAETALSGTLLNCAGGVTPWGSWISCEELVIEPGQEWRDAHGHRIDTFRQGHGYAFEVPASGPATARALPGLGLMRHEAVAIDPATGIVYLTEDRQPASGFYRFIPDQPGNLSGGGQLEMLAAEGAPELIRGLKIGQRWRTRWVPIAEPWRGHSPGTTDQGGVVAQGLALGGSAFLRLEGCLHRDGEIWFTSTSGGDAGGGQVWRHHPAEAWLELVFEVSDRQVMDYPDNITSGPGGGLVVCEDSQISARQRIVWLARSGKVVELAENIQRIDGVDHGSAEWAGVCFSPDGRWLFANLYRPGCTVAITGPWEQWLEAHT